MAKKAFEIQSSDLVIGGVNLQAGATTIVIPGVTQAADYFVEEVDEYGSDDNQDLGSDVNAVTVIDNADYVYRSGGAQPSGDYASAGYSVDELDDGNIEEIIVENQGIFLTADKSRAEASNMWATLDPTPFAPFNADNWIQIPFRPKMRAGGVENVGGGGDGLPTVTIPAAAGTTYKGLQVSYGMIHSNSGGINELNVNKIVIHKPAITTTEIDPTGGQDYFRVSGLGDSDVLAMFVLYGDVNGAKPLSDLQAFAQAAIDNVILDNAVEGEYQSVANMRAAFYDNYPSLAIAANGLDLDFNFYNNFTPVITGATTVREGIGAVFEIGDNGLGAYTASGIQNNGINYQAGHKIKVLGTALGGVTPDNDCIITVVNTFGNGEIFQWSVEGVAAGVVSALYAPVTGTNYNVGSDFNVSQINFNNLNAFDFFSTIAQGVNYVVGDVLTLPGSGIEGGSSPANDITITVTAVDGGGGITATTATGVFPRVWPENNINDGGNDQYDTANYINSENASGIGYNQGNTVTDGTSAFGAGSSYTVVYDTGIFGLLVTGNSSTFIETNGNSGADGNSTTEAGNIYGPDTAAQTFDNAVTHINIVGGGSEGQEGIRFADGTRLTSAEGVGRVKLESSGNRRIEEAYGYKTVALSQVVTTGLTAVASRASNNSFDIWVDTTATTIDDIIDNPQNYNNAYGFEFSLDNNTWYRYDFGYGQDGNERAFSIAPTLVSYNQGDTIYFRYKTGGAPVVWWDKNELPGGSTNFRGAVIDYHAYTGEATWIGTIHIVDDDGEENVTHTEVSSGSTDAENDDLWLVQNEGTISYRRIDGEGKTLRVQWSAKVFYGSEYYDD